MKAYAIALIASLMHLAPCVHSFAQELDFNAATFGANQNLRFLLEPRVPVFLKDDAPVPVPQPVTPVPMRMWYPELSTFHTIRYGFASERKSTPSDLEAKSLK